MDNKTLTINQIFNKCLTHSVPSTCTYTYEGGILCLHIKSLSDLPPPLLSLCRMFGAVTGLSILKGTVCTEYKLISYETSSVYDSNPIRPYHITLRLTLIHICTHLRAIFSYNFMIFSSFLRGFLCSLCLIYLSSKCINQS